MPAFPVARLRGGGFRWGSVIPRTLDELFSGLHELDKTINHAESRLVYTLTHVTGSWRLGLFVLLSSVEILEN